MLPHTGDYFRTTYRFLDRRTNVDHNFGSSAKVRYVSAALAGDLMEALHQNNVCDIDTIYRKIFKRQYLGDYYSYSDVIVHSHTARNGLRGDLDLRKGVKTL